MPDASIDFTDEEAALVTRAAHLSEALWPKGFVRDAAVAAARRRIAVAEAVDRACDRSRGVFALVDRSGDEATGEGPRGPIREGGDPVPAVAPFDEDELRWVLRQALGGASSVRDQEALDMVLAEHAQTDGLDVFDQAAALLVGLARLEPFHRGSRKTAWAAALAWLDLNGLRLHRRFDDEFAAWIVRRAAAGEDSADDVADELRAAAAAQREHDDEQEK